MNERDDHELQQWLENQQAISHSATELDKDQKTYLMLFEALKQEPPGGLSYKFSLTVEKAIRQQKKQARQALWVALVGVSISVGLLLIGISWMMPRSQPAAQLLLSMGRYKWPLLFGLVNLLLMQFLDRKLVIDDQLPRIT